ncbi:MAG: EEP domain-containing protein, partial [Polaromonas sp.]
MNPPESLDVGADIKKSPAAPHEPVPPAADADVRAEAQQALATAAKTFSLKVLTVNIHKGFTFFNRKFILPELREAVRKIGAD